MKEKIQHRDNLDPEHAAIYPYPWIYFPEENEEGNPKCFQTKEQAEAYAKA